MEGGGDNTPDGMLTVKPDERTPLIVLEAAVAVAD